MEKLIYESRPFLFIAVALAALLKGNGTLLMTGSAVLLLLCSVYVLYKRRQYREYYRIA